LAPTELVFMKCDFVNETNLVQNFFSVYFIKIIYKLYMLWTSPGTSTEGRTVFMWHLSHMFCIAGCLVYFWSVNSILHTRQSAIQNTSAKCHIKYSSSSWWLTWRGAKYVGVINNIDEIHWEKTVPQVGFIYKII
jgi:hypothetical protein